MTVAFHERHVVMNCHTLFVSVHAAVGSAVAASRRFTQCLVQSVQYSSRFYWL
jgi:hypothetical protein